VTINPTTAAGYQGEYVQDNGYFIVGALSYNVIQTGMAATGNPVTWSNGGIAYADATTAGNWEIVFTITLNSLSIQTSHTYTITVTSTQASGATVTTLFTYGFTTLSSITTGQSMTFIWDTSAQTWTAPSAIQVTVA
jgi:hypothetical protein